MADAHILQTTPATLEVTFYADGTPAADSPVTVGVTRADGTDLVPPGTATTPGGTGVYRVALTAAHTAELDRLKATWTGATQTHRTWAEVVGGHLYTEADARGLKSAGKTPLASDTDFPDKVILATRAQVTDDFKLRGEVAFAARFARETHSGDGDTWLMLRRNLPHRIISVTVDGTALTGAELADLDIEPGRVLVRKTLGGFARGVRNITVAYAHGYEQAPAEIGLAALRRTLMILNPSVAGSTVSSWTSPDGTTYSYDQAGQVIPGTSMIRHYGVPAVDVPLNVYGMVGLAVASP